MWDINNVFMNNGSFVIKNGKLIKCHVDVAGEIVIPKSVTEIGTDAFIKHKGITHVTIPDSVTVIGINAFRDCENLISINIPKSVNKIKERAFLNCPKLQSIKIDQDNEIYDSRANCNAIIETSTNVLISGSNTTVIPESVVAIGDSAFWGFVGLRDIHIPSSVTSIGTKAFRECCGIEKITVDPNNKKYDSRENCNAIIDTFKNELVVGCKNTEIPTSVEHIGDFSFLGCSGLKSINIHNNIKTIGAKAFRGCWEVKSLYIPKSVIHIKEGAFADIPYLASIVVNEHNKMYDSRENCNAIVHTVSNSLVSGCACSRIPKSIREIGGWAFCGCLGLTHMVIHDKIEKLGEKAFRGCHNLQYVEIGKSVSEINWRAFSNCDSLRSIRVHKDNPTFDSREDCNAIIHTETNCMLVGCAASYVPNTVNRIGESAFWHCHSLLNITIPASITAIDAWAFCGCISLSVLHIPDSVTQIGERAFRCCASLTEVVLPDHVTHLYKETFFRCDKLSVLSIGRSVEYLDDTTFWACCALKTVYVNSAIIDNVKSIIHADVEFVTS